MAAQADTVADPRIHVSLAQLRALERSARNLSFLPRQPARSVLNGRHASRLRGRGLNFEELRGYLPGDDIRSIDWKVTARTGEPHVRVYSEERDRPALLLVDQRMSMFFGTRHAMKSVTAAEAAALAAWRVLAAGDRVGGIVFDDEDLLALKPQRSRRAVHALLSTIARCNQALQADRLSAATPMPLNRPLQQAARIAGHDHLLLVISDFDGIDDDSHRHLSTLARHNDVVLILVHDPSARELPDLGSLVVSDGRLQVTLDTGTASRRQALEEVATGRLQRILDWQNQLGVAVLPLSTAEPTLTQVRRLLGRIGPRAGRRGRGR